MLRVGPGWVAVGYQGNTSGLETCEVECVEPWGAHLPYLEGLLRAGGWRTGTVARQADGEGTVASCRRDPAAQLHSTLHR